MEKPLIYQQLVTHDFYSPKHLTVFCDFLSSVISKSRYVYHRNSVTFQKFDGKKGWKKETIVLNEDSCEPLDVYVLLIKIQMDKEKCFLFNMD